ncbi:MAG: amidohydrolase family protein [Pseudomonadota bacterium]
MSNESTLFRNVNVIDGTGDDAFTGHVLVESNRIQKVATTLGDLPQKAGQVIDGAGKTLMPGLCDAHLHMTWNDQPTLEHITLMPPEEHLIHSINVAKTVLDAGFTSGVGAAAARPRFDCILRNAINAGDIVGPRYLANGQEICTAGGLGDTSPVHVDVQDLSFGWRVCGPEEMRKAVRMFVKFGVDLIKLNLSGEEITPVPAQTTPMSDEEVAMAIKEAKPYGIRACAHARSADSVKQCLDHGVEIIYHASYADEECMDRLEEHKDRFFVGPGLAWLIQTSQGAADWGIPPDSELAQVYARELEYAVEGMKEMRKRGIRIVPGGDYGFAWTPHGSNAKDLEYFVDLIGMSPMEAIVSATGLGGQIMNMPDELGLIKEGYLADLLLVDGDPSRDITVLQDHEKLQVIMKDGAFHKNSL